MTAAAPAAPPLVVADVDKSFAGLHALSQVSFELRRGRRLALIGPNGAGKSTLINVVMGVVAPDAGSVRVHGSELVGLATHRIVSSGLARTFQTPRVMTSDGATLLDNLLLGATPALNPSIRRAVLGRRQVRQAEAAQRDRAMRWLELLGLADRAAAPADALPLAGRRLLEIGRAMMSDPTLVLLDEPAAGLTEEESGVLTGVLDEITARGTDLLLVEHNMRLVMQVVDDLVVLDKGRVIARGPAAEVAEDPVVIQAYLGTSGPTAAEGR